MRTRWERPFFSSAEEFVDAYMATWFEGPYRTPHDVPSNLRDRVRKMALAGRSQIDLRRKAAPLDPPFRERLSEIRLPILLVTGSSDMPDILDAAKRLEAELETATSVTVQDVAHLVPLEKPEEFNRLTKRFLKQKASLIP